MTPSHFRPLTSPSRPLTLSPPTTHDPHPSLQEATEDRCLSLMTQDGALDLEAASKTEREALVQGFSMILAEDPAQRTTGLWCF